MGCYKNYLLELVCACSEHAFGQEVLMWAVLDGRVRLTGNRDEDLRTLTENYDTLISLYRAAMQTPALAAA